MTAASDTCDDVSVLLTKVAGSPARLERVDLILHQRDERRDDDRELGQDHRRHLIAERLSSARRQHHERVASGEDGLDGGFLSRAKRRIAEVFVKRGAGRFERRGSGHSLTLRTHAHPRRHHTSAARRITPHGQNARA